MILVSAQVNELEKPRIHSTRTLDFGSLDCDRLSLSASDIRIADSSRVPFWFAPVLSLRGPNSSRKFAIRHSKSKHKSELELELPKVAIRSYFEPLSLVVIRQIEGKHLADGSHTFQAHSLGSKSLSKPPPSYLSPPSGPTAPEILIAALSKAPKIYQPSTGKQKLI